ncbi:MAG: phosphotransferase [Streptosporangiales bacterium]|nr:phosphotransferase [Streptosporangiales bacterium]
MPGRSALPDVANRLLGQPTQDWQPVGGGCIGDCARVTLTDGRSVFVKTMADPPAHFFAAEAAGLRWLAEAGGPPVPEVLAAGEDGIALAWVPTAGASATAAEQLGGELARMHAAGADSFGAPWSGFIGSLPMDNSPAADWPTFYAERRLLPYARQAFDRGHLDADQLALVERVADRLGELAGQAEPPARIHGDLWSGNLHWAADGRCWLLDPAAHGGHRETDLAMLALFGAPHLDRLVDAYREAATDLGAPLADGWRDRIPLHQLWPLLVHAVLFGSGYGAQAAAAARTALRTN